MFAWNRQCKTINILHFKLKRKEQKLGAPNLFGTKKKMYQAARLNKLREQRTIN